MDPREIAHLSPSSAAEGMGGKRSLERPFLPHPLLAPNPFFEGLQRQLLQGGRRRGKGNRSLSVFPPPNAPIPTPALPRAFASAALQVKEVPNPFRKRRRRRERSVGTTRPFFFPYSFCGRTNFMPRSPRNAKERVFQNRDEHFPLKVEFRLEKALSACSIVGPRCSGKRLQRLRQTFFFSPSSPFPPSHQYPNGRV